MRESCDGHIVAITDAHVCLLTCSKYLASLRKFRSLCQMGEYCCCYVQSTHDDPIDIQRQNRNVPAFIIC